MPKLNDRQYQEGAQFIVEKLTGQGFSDDDIIETLGGLDKSEMQSVVQKHWVESKKMQTGSVPDFMETAGSGFLAGTATRGLAAKAHARADATDITPKFEDGKMVLEDAVPYEQALAEREDRMALAELENPKTFTLFQIVGFINPVGFMSKVGGLTTKAAAKVLPKVAATESLKRVATRTGISGGASLAAHSSLEELTDGSSGFDVGRVATETALGAAGGAASPYVAAGAKSALRAGGKAVNSTLDLYKRTTHKIAEKRGTLTPRMNEILGDIGDFVKFEKAGRPVKEATQKIRLGMDKARDRVKGKAADVQARLQGFQEKVGSLIDDAQKSLGFDDFEFSQTADDVSKFLKQGLDDFAREIQEKASSGAEITKKQIESSFYGLQNMVRSARSTFSSEYARQLAPYEQAGKNLKIDAAAEMKTVIDTFKRNNLFVEVNGRIRGFNPSAQLSGKQKFALLRMLRLAQQPGNFAEVNKAKKAIGSVMESVPDPEMRSAFHTAYQGLRSKLLRSFDAPDARKLLNTHALALADDSLPGGGTLGKEHLDNVFKEYWAGNQVVSKFEKAFEGKTPDDLGLSTLRKLAAEAGALDVSHIAEAVPRFKALSPVNKEIIEGLKSIISAKTREVSYRPLMDINKVHAMLSKLPKQFDASKSLDNIEAVVGPLAHRREFSRFLDNSEIPKEIVSAAKAGGARWTALTEKLKAEMPEVLPAVQRLHDRYQKFSRLAGYKHNELIEGLRLNKVDPQIVDDLQDLISFKPEISKLFNEKTALEIARGNISAAQKKAVAKVQSLDPSRIGAPSLTLTGAEVTRGSLAWMLGGKAAALVGLAVDRVTKLLTNPAHAAFIAEKYKLVPKERAADWGREVAAYMSQVLPAVNNAKTIIEEKKK